MGRRLAIAVGWASIEEVMPEATERALGGVLASGATFVGHSQIAAGRF